MPTLKFAGLSAVVVAVLLLMFGASGAMAQQRHATGAAAAPPERLQSIPQAPVFRDFLPQAVDLSKYMPAVGDQGNQGSCVGWATAYAARAYYAEQVEHRDTDSTANIPSPAWIFDIIHLGNDCNQGSYVPDALDVLKSGAYSLADFPYDDTKCPLPLPPQRAKASDFKIAGYDRLDTMDLDSIKGALATGNPVIVLASLDNGFFNLSPKNRVWHSDKSKKDEGGHAFTLTGYDDRSQTFKFINQWSTQWGDKGYGYMDYDTFQARVLEAYIIHMPGDPEIVLADADFTPDVIDTTPPPPVFNPPLNVRPTEANRDFAMADDSVDVGDLACGKVELTTDADGNSVAAGFVGTQADLDKVNETLKDKVDVNNVTLAPWPACEVQLTLAAPLADSDTPQALVEPASPKIGDSVQIGVESPGFASYLYAAYFSADGSVITFTQPTSSDLKAKPAHTQVKFGDADAGQMALTVSPPVGDEMLLVVASEKPLFASALPDSQTDRQFLTALREGVLAGDAGRVTATVLPVTTVE